MERCDARAQYEAWHPGRDDRAGIDTPWHRLLAPRLKLGGCRVLEIASGRGGFAAWMAARPGAERPLQVVAADFAHSALRQAKELGDGGRVSVAQADIMRLPFPSGAFDAVVSCETLEHVADPQAGLAELHRVLRQAGTLYLTMPNYFGTLGLYRAFRELTGREWTETGQPINHPLRSTRVSAWLKRCGFAIEVMDGAGHFIPVPGRRPVNLSALDGIRPLRRFAQHIAFVATKT
jgi:SAM-dependent methyltransferase